MGIRIFQDVDHLYNCKGSFASGLAFASTDITRRLLDTESSELPASSCGPILFSPTHLLRLIDHRYVLANSLSQPSPPQVLQNNQFKLTQVLQSLLRTSAGILAMALRDEELFPPSPTDPLVSFPPNPAPLSSPAADPGSPSPSISPASAATSPFSRHLPYRLFLLRLGETPSLIPLTLPATLRVKLPGCSQR